MDPKQRNCTSDIGYIRNRDGSSDDYGNRDGSGDDDGGDGRLAGQQRSFGQRVSTSRASSWVILSRSRNSIV